MNNTSKNLTLNLPLWSYQMRRDSKLVMKSRQDLEHQLIVRTFKDEAFKQTLLANPTAVVEQELGNELAAGTQVRILEETASTLYFVLPSNPYPGLSEAELLAAVSMTYEELAGWMLDQQGHCWLDENSSVASIVRAWKDETFKQQLLSQPAVAISQVSGTSLPADVEIRAVEETANALYIVLPKMAAVQDAMLVAGWVAPVVSSGELALDVAATASDLAETALNLTPEQVASIDTPGEQASLLTLLDVADGNNDGRIDLPAGTVVDLSPPLAEGNTITLTEDINGTINPDGTFTPDPIET
ncbi:MAG: NHLP leader peptide family RiPP precursor [Geitlerinemataceae cyanobacterium]